MDEMGEKEWLRKSQYGDSSNLNSRRRLHERYSTNPYPWFEWLFTQLNLTRGSRIVELGGGSGQLWTENAARLSPDISIIYSDFSIGMADDAGRAFSKKNVRARLAVIDADSIALRSQVADVVIANHMLYHAADVRDCLLEIERILTPTGILHASTVGKDHLKEIVSLIDMIDKELGYESATDPENEDMEMPFLLENGAAILSGKFSEVSRMEYRDELRIDDPGALIEFVFSSADYDDDEKEEVERIVRSAFPKNEIFSIGKRMGLFSASNSFGYSRA